MKEEEISACPQTESTVHFMKAETTMPREGGSPKSSVNRIGSLHESRNLNAKRRRITKMISKQNWFKRKPEDSPGSRGKRMRGVEMDGNHPRRLDIGNETDIDID